MSEVARRERASVSLTTRPMWRLRLGQELPRRLLQAAAVAGLIASIRFAIAPPRPVSLPMPAAKPPDLAAEGFATLFARVYLSWHEDDPEARQQALEPFLGSSLAPEAGAPAPARGSQQVVDEQVVGEREPQLGLHIFTVAVDIEPGGLLYLTVPVLHRAGGAPSLAGYPAIVGRPAFAPASTALRSGGEVEDSGLRTVIARALGNYLAPAPSDLAADLAAGAQVSPPEQGLKLEALQSLTWARAGAVVAQVAVAAANGARLTLAYEVGVLDVRGRWEIAAIEMSPHE